MAEKNQPVQVPRRRVITKKLEEGQVVSVPLARDTTYVGLHIRLRAKVKAIWASGTPQTRPEGAMDSLIKYIEVNTDRLGTIKYLKPHFLQMQQLQAMGIESERLYNVGAAATDFPTTSGAPQFGTSGQIISIDESVYLPFEQVYCEPGMGRELTYLNAQRATSAEIKFTCGNLLDLCANPGSMGTLALDAPNSNFEVIITTVERQDISPNVVFQVWKQIQKTENFGGKVDDKAIEINTENRLAALSLFTLNGDTLKLPSNKVLSKIILKKNGDSNMQEVNFPDLQKINRLDYGIVAATAAGANRLDGFAHLSQISRRSIDTILDTSKEGGGIYSLQLMVSTNDAPTVDYTKPATLFIVTEEILNGK